MITGYGLSSALKRIKSSPLVVRQSHQRAKEGKTRKIGSEAYCERCGRPYIVKGASQKYCDNCVGIMIQEKARQRSVSQKVPVTLTCQICGKEFTSTANNKPKYCSDACREEAGRRYRKEYWKTYKKKREFEESRQLLLDYQRNFPEKTGMLEGVEFVEPMLSRRIRATTNYLPILKKMYDEYQHVTSADYAYYLSQPVASIGQLDLGGSLCTGAAFWMLDILKAHHKMSELYGILPFLTDDDDVEMPVVEDVCHSYETIRRLVSVIQKWFYSTLGLDPPEGSDSALSTFVAIVDLIPDEVKTRAVQRLDDKIWEWADIFLAAYDDILEKIGQVEEKRKRVDAEIDETQKSLEQLIKGKKKSATRPLAAPLAFPFASAGSPQVSPFPSQMLSPTSGNSVRDAFGEKVFSLAAQAERLDDEKAFYQTQERSLCRFAPIYSTLSTSLLEEKLGKPLP